VAGCGLCKVVFLRRFSPVDLDKVITPAFGAHFDIASALLPSVLLLRGTGISSAMTTRPWYIELLVQVFS
jgi:hypothetical protein